VSVAPDFAPVVTDAVFGVSSSDGPPVNVPLVLARHVAELPPSQALALEMAAKLRRRIEGLRRERRASFAWLPTRHAGAGFVGPGAVQLFFREGTMQVWAKGDLSGRETQSLLLDTNAALLFQGTLNLFLHFLNPLLGRKARPAPYLVRDDVLVPEIINRDIALVVTWVEEKLASEVECIELFAIPLADRYGRETVLRAVWDVESAHVSWQWAFDEMPSDGTDRDGRRDPHAAYLDVEQATWVSGFITLVRLAYPQEWTWVPDGGGE
jgi:hypothetical protein